MQSVDVSVLLHACLEGAPSHAVAGAALDLARRSPEGLGLLSTVAVGFVRLATDRRVVEQPLSAREAVSFLDEVLAPPGAGLVEPGPRHWALFCGLVTDMELQRSDVTDAWLAAAAIESNATWVSFDRGFARFTGLRWVNPAAA